MNVQQNITSYKEGNANDLHKILLNEYSATLMNNSVINNDTPNLDELMKNSTKTLTMYSAMIFSFITLELIKTYFVLVFARNASIKLHRTMVDTILFSVMSFFDSHFIGNILNRFAQDLNVVDERLPHVLSHLIEVRNNSHQWRLVR